MEVNGDDRNYLFCIKHTPTLVRIFAVDLKYLEEDEKQEEAVLGCQGWNGGVFRIKENYN